MAIIKQYDKRSGITYAYEAAYQNQSKTEQVANPFGIFCVIFIALHGFNSFWIGNGYVDTIFQKMEDRHPVLASGFHADIKTVIDKQPLFKMVDVRIKRREAFFLVRRLDTICSFNNCGNEKFFIDIDATAGVVNNFHVFITPFNQNRRSH